MLVLSEGEEMKSFYSWCRTSIWVSRKSTDGGEKKESEVPRPEIYHSHNTSAAGEVDAHRRVTPPKNVM